MNNFNRTYKTPVAATAMYKLMLPAFQAWKKEQIALLKEHVHLLKEDVLAEREEMGGNTVYCGWGTTVDNAVQDLWDLEDAQLVLEGTNIRIKYPD